MDYEEIKKLMDDMGNSKLNSIEIEFPDGVKISMTKNEKQEVAVQTVMPVEQTSQAIATTVPASVPSIQVNTENNLINVPQEEKQEENYKLIKSPMVGTFYASFSPDKEPFVKVGDRIHKGQVVCIVEAMKLMNEIESEFDGEIVEICVKNEDVVEYGMPLFKVK